MGFCHFLGRLLLVVINLVLVLVSVTLIAFGFLVKYSGSTFKKYTDPVLDDIVSSAKGSFGDTNFTADNFDLAELFGTMATILIIMGFVLLAISFFGSCGACCDMKCMLMSYAVVLIVLVIGQITFVVFLFGYPDVLKDATKKPLKKLLKTYQGLNGTNVESLAWNFAMKEFSCCGLEGYEDFKNGDSLWFGEDDANWKTPVACCKTLPKTVTGGGPACATTDGHDTEHNNYNKGCVDEIWKYLIEENKTYTYVGAGGGLAFQILMVVFAFVLYCQDDNKVSPQNNKSKTQRGRQGRSAW